MIFRTTAGFLESFIIAYYSNYFIFSESFSNLICNKRIRKFFSFFLIIFKWGLNLKVIINYLF